MTSISAVRGHACVSRTGKHLTIVVYASGSNPHGCKLKTVQSRLRCETASSPGSWPLTSETDLMYTFRI